MIWWGVIYSSHFTKKLKGQHCHSSNSSSLLLLLTISADQCTHIERTQYQPLIDYQRLMLRAYSCMSMGSIRNAISRLVTYHYESRFSLTCKLPSPLQPTPAALYSTADAVVGAGEERQWWSVKAPLMELIPRGDGGGIGNGDGMDASLWKVHMHSCGSPCPGNRDEPWLPQLLPYLTKAHLP